MSKIWKKFQIYRMENGYNKWRGAKKKDIKKFGKNFVRNFLS